MTETDERLRRLIQVDSYKKTCVFRGMGVTMDQRRRLMMASKCLEKLWKHLQKQLRLGLGPLNLLAEERPIRRVRSRSRSRSSGRKARESLMKQLKIIRNIEHISKPSLNLHKLASFCHAFHHFESFSSLFMAFPSPEPRQTAACAEQGCGAAALGGSGTGQGA